MQTHLADRGNFAHIESGHNIVFLAHLAPCHHYLPRRYFLTLI